MASKKEKNRRNDIEKMRNLLRPEPRMFQAKMQKKLEFGYTYNAQYRRHTGHVKNIFWNANTR